MEHEIDHIDVTNERELSAAVATHHWYHTIELPGGVVTPGRYDHRPLLPHYGLPKDLGGMRTLDVATFDGFWAFEMERRGANVSAIDVERVSQLDLPDPVQRQRSAEGYDAPISNGFRLAQRALGSTVNLAGLSVYDLSPSNVGTFDLVHLSDLLLHLRSPIQALTAVRSVTAGSAVISDVFHPGLTVLGGLHSVEYVGGWSDLVWWIPSLQALGQMVIDAGFRSVSLHAVYNLARRQERTGFWRAVLLAET
ncbi:MAG TPA: methyltransferase domain-containing protein [Mycobacteriales bacterium]|nr:methyltransferase domain-containing protein [Mycobacteriales bacterium]